MAEYHELVKNINSIQTIDTSNLVQKAIVEIEKKISIIATPEFNKLTK